MNLDTATPLQRGIYNMCLELERLPASAFQTRLVSLLSDANLEIERLRAALASRAAATQEWQPIETHDGTPDPVMVFCDPGVGQE